MKMFAEWRMEGATIKRVLIRNQGKRERIPATVSIVKKRTVRKLGIGIILKLENTKNIARMLAEKKPVPTTAIIVENRLRNTGKDMQKFRGEGIPRIVRDSGEFFVRKVAKRNDCKNQAMN